ncbi:hypothetical protein [Streptomyces sp. JH34]|uniref:effector-associated constant component EACC1 n=1 Tax=Streptomyces sp. JH34 TaxID=2793633 RepID=UPI0023F63F89|nr:hypothetical protein [Streptomyces sp. JH34]MDF6018819.1 hypothetical protein [Streptomyces sp. JH34]
MTEAISSQRAGDSDAPFEVVLSVSEPADVGALYRRLSPLAGLEVSRMRSRPGEGQLGVVEVLQLLVPSAAVLTVAIRTLPAFIKSRRSSVTVTLTRGKRSVTVTVENSDDPQTVLEIASHLLGDD